LVLAKLDVRGGGENAVGGGLGTADCRLLVREEIERGGPDRRDDAVLVLCTEGAKEKELLELG
jgi:hypothetical protein